MVRLNQHPRRPTHTGVQPHAARVECSRRPDAPIGGVIGRAANEQSNVTTDEQA